MVAIRRTLNEHNEVSQIVKDTDALLTLTKDYIQHLAQGISAELASKEVRTAIGAMTFEQLKTLSEARASINSEMQPEHTLHFNHIHQPWDLHFQRLSFLQSPLFNKLSAASEIYDIVIRVKIENNNYMTLLAELRTLLNTTLSNVIADKRSWNPLVTETQGAVFLHKLNARLDSINLHHSALIFPQTQAQANKVYLEGIQAGIKGLLDEVKAKKNQTDEYIINKLSVLTNLQTEVAEILENDDFIADNSKVRAIQDTIHADVFQKAVGAHYRPKLFAEMSGISASQKFLNEAERLGKLVTEQRLALAPEPVRASAKV